MLYANLPREEAADNKSIDTCYERSSHWSWESRRSIGRTLRYLGTETLRYIERDFRDGFLVKQFQRCEASGHFTYIESTPYVEHKAGGSPFV